MFCRNCGKDISGAGKFCPYCGQPIKGGQPDAGNSLAGDGSGQSNAGGSQAEQGGHRQNVGENQSDAAENNGTKDGSSMDQYRKYEPIFGAWYLKRLIGEGGFGKVFEIERRDFGQVYRAALKVITIPQEKGEIDNLHSEGMSNENVSGYYKNYAQDIISEFALLSKLKGNSYIVSYEDHTAIPHEDNIGWDILARMELLTPLTQYMEQHALSPQEVAKIGIDICRALEVCGKYNIIHRDIKPENIFVSELGTFKLGDFGIARQMARSQSVLSKKGTFIYMAPELYKEEKSDATVDIYSLGLVLYRLGNKNRMPFLPPYPQMITYQDREESLKKRISGEKMPAPADADKELSSIILKACSYKAHDRWQTPAELREALENYLALCAARQKGRKAIREHKKQVKLEKKQKGAKKRKAIAIAALMLLLLCAGCVAAATLLLPRDKEEGWGSKAVAAVDETESQKMTEETVETESPAETESSAETESQTAAVETNTAGTEVSTETSTVMEETQTEPVTEEETEKEVELSSMKLVNSSDRYTLVESGSYMDSLGNEYYSGNLFYLSTYGNSYWGEYGFSENRCGFGEYYLGRGYKTLKGLLAVSDDTSNEDVSARLEIYGDNRVLAYYDFNRKTRPFEIELDVSEVDYLAFNLVFRTEEGEGDVGVLMQDMVLTPNPNPLPEKEEIGTKLVDLKATNGNDGFVQISSHARTDVLGNVYSPANLFEVSVNGNTAWGNNGYDEDRTAFAEYCIDSQYTTLTGVLAPSDKIDPENPGLQGILVVLGDDKVLGSFLVNSTTGATEVNLDVSGVEWIRFEFQFNAADAAGDVYALMSDFVFE